MSRKQNTGTPEAASGSRHLQKQLETFRVLYDLALAMTAEHGLDANLERIAARAQGLLKTGTCIIALVDPLRRELCMHTCRGTRTPAFERMRLPMGQGLGGMIAQTRQGYIVRDYLHDEHFRHRVDDIIAAEGLVSGLAVPIQTQAELWGVIYAFNREPTDFSRADLDTLTLIANLAAVEIERKGVARRLGESERRFRAIFDQTFEFVGLLAPDGTLLAANRTALDFAGVSEADVVGRPFWKTAWWRHSRAAQEELHAAVARAARGEFVRFETTHPAADGHLEYFDFSLRPVHGPEGKVEWLIPEGRRITERKQAEEILAAEKETFFSILENAPYGVVYLDPQGNYVYVNPEFTHITGYRQEDVPTGSDWFRKAFPNRKYRREVIAVWKQRGGDQGLNRVFEVVCKDGGTKEIDFRPTLLADGRAVLMLADITARRRMETALRQSEETARALLNAAMDSAILLDLEGRIIAINRVAAERFETPVETLIGQPIFTYITPMLIELRRAHFLEVVRAGRPVRFEDAAGGRYFDNSVYPVMDAAGRVQRVAVYARDITAYKQAQARLEAQTRELAASEEKYRTLVENVPLVVYRMSPRGEILFINQMGEGLIGYDRSTIIAQPRLWLDNIHPDDRLRILELRRKCFHEGREFSAEYRVRHAEGHYVCVLDHILPYLGPGGEITSVDGIIMDISDRVRLQEKLRKEEELKTVGEVSARLAHEIRNPLAVAGGFARRVLATLERGDPNREKVEIILKEIARLEGILKMILTYLRPVELHWEHLDLNAVVQAALSDLQPRLETDAIQVAPELAVDLPPIEGDGARLEEMLEILILNALKQMASGATLRVSSRQEAQDVLLILSYRPTHISRDDVAHFFFPFFASRADAETLPLPLSKILVNKHGGTIDVELGPEDDLAIRIRLPLAQLEGSGN